MKDFGDEVVQTEDKITGDSPVLDNTEFLVSYRYRHILKPDVLDRFPRRVINLHISCLPWNRGCHPNVWSFIEDSQKGVTIHYIDPGVDTGDILAQEEVQFSSTETLRTSYNTLSARIEELFKRTWPDIRSGRMEARPQPPGGKDGILQWLILSEKELNPGIAAASWSDSDRAVAQLSEPGTRDAGRQQLRPRPARSERWGFRCRGV
jgi:methionyl-tRNA formyltransferase